jgi:hypothetical protein
MSRLIACAAVAVLASGCATFAGSYAIPSLIMVSLPTGRVGDGEGTTSDEASKRLAAARQAALVETTRGALVAATRAPGDVRLQRRAAALVRELARGRGDDRDQLVDRALVDRVLGHLATALPCPGLADVGATREALGEHGAAGDAYLRCARECDSIEAALAAVRPLRNAERCGDAIDALRAAWPKVDRQRRGAEIEVLDGVAACSDAVSLRRNLSFVPPDVIDDYAALLDARQEAARESQRRAEAYQRERDAEERARAATWRCESECSSAVSSCQSSCSGDASCSQRCTSIGHSCRAGCGAY